jgi:hypothetical protein
MEGFRVRRLDWSALALFAILFVWQFPHFYAIAWMHRDDYARGGIRMLPVIDPAGEMTAKRVVACSLLLIPVSLLPRSLGMTGAHVFHSGGSGRYRPAVLRNAFAAGACYETRSPVALSVRVVSAGDPRGDGIDRSQ